MAGMLVSAMGRKRTSAHVLSMASLTVDKELDLTTVLVVLAPCPTTPTITAHEPSRSEGEHKRRTELTFPRSTGNLPSSLSGVQRSVPLKPRSSMSLPKGLRKSSGSSRASRSAFCHSNPCLGRKRHFPNVRNRWKADIVWIA